MYSSIDLQIHRAAYLQTKRGSTDPTDLNDSSLLCEVRGDLLYQASPRNILREPHPLSLVNISCEKEPNLPEITMIFVWFFGL